MLIPHGVSGAIKRETGYAPFRELRKAGVLPLGGAVLTGAGRLPFAGIIHVAGIGHPWCASEDSILRSARNALTLAKTHGFPSIAFPLIGAGVGGGRPEAVERFIAEEARASDFPGEIRIVRWRR